MAQFGERGIRWRTGGRRGADGLADHGADGGLIEGRQAAVGECGELAGDPHCATTSVRPEMPVRALREVVVESGRGARVGVSRARHTGAGGDGVVDRGQGAGDVEQAVRLGERCPDAGGVGCADPGGEQCDGASNVVHRLAQPGRDLPGPLS
ncbi:hypothetical protein BEH93_23330 [Streptomyces sp. 2R]|nr:hypothetical protein BEH93_23330 [Streptomyces sp. 2R]